MANAIRKSGRLLAFVGAALILGPLMALGGIVAALSLLDVWLPGNLLPGSVLNLAFGGPDHPAFAVGSYVSFMVGAMVASGSLFALKFLWGRYRAASRVMRQVWYYPFSPSYSASRSMSFRFSAASFLSRSLGSLVL